MTNWFTKHPESVGESYWIHMRFASLCGLKMIMGGFACLIHAVFPFLFSNTGSNILFRFMENFIQRAPVKEKRLIALANQINEKQ